MSDLLIDDLSVHYNASKNRDYRERVVERFRAFISFLQDHGLTVRPILAPGERPDVTTKIMRSDLTEEGYALVLDAYDKWLKLVSASDAVIETALLEESLRKIRAIKRDAANNE